MHSHPLPWPITSWKELNGPSSHRTKFLSLPRLLLPGSGITPQQIRDLADPLALASTVLTTAPLAEVSEQSLEAY